MADLRSLVSQRLAALYPQLDPRAVLSVASQEGLSGKIGDSGHAFGPFQLNNAGGVITGKFPGQSPQQIQSWASSPAGIDYALGGIAKVAGGLRGPKAINAIVSRFERPADIPGEIAGATSAYGTPGSMPTTTSMPSMPLGQPAVPGAGPRLQPVNMPLAPRLPASASQGSFPLSAGSSILPSSFSSSDILGSAAKALGMEPVAAPHPLSTPVQQVQQPVQRATTPTGLNVEVAGKPSPSDIRAVQLAEHFIGTPYQWGGASPSSGFDCSGLIQYVWGKQGVEIPRTTYDQFQSGTPVAKKDLQAGDAVYFTGSDPMNGLPGHVGMYIGNGKFVEAPHTGADIRISELSGRSDYVGARSFA